MESDLRELVKQGYLIRKLKSESKDPLINLKKKFKEGLDPKNNKEIVELEPGV